MTQAYILVEAYACDLPYEVAKRVEEGYVPQGGPFPGRDGISSRKIVQAMFNERYVEIKRGPVGLKLPTTQELDDAVDEANAASPGSASKSERTFITIDLADAQLIDALLEIPHAQYPTEHQEAVLRFKRTLHGTQKS